MLEPESEYENALFRQIRHWKKEVERLRAELAECRHLLKLVVCEGCDQLDHGPDKAFHGFTDPCPILERIDAALAKGE